MSDKPDRDGDVVKGQGYWDELLRRIVARELRLPKPGVVPLSPAGRIRFHHYTSSPLVCNICGRTFVNADRMFSFCRLQCPLRPVHKEAE